MRKQRTDFALSSACSSRTYYQLATASVASTARETAVDKDTRFSDHAPLTVRYELAI